MPRFRSRLTFANVVSLVALFVALGGSSYAVVQLSKNSVGSRHIKKGAVKRADLARNSVTGAKVRDGTLGTRDFSPDQLAGLQGEQGPAGVQGPPGPAAPEAWALRKQGGAIVSKGVTSITPAAINGQYRVLFAEGVGPPGQNIEQNCAIFVMPADTNSSVNPDAVDVGPPGRPNVVGSVQGGREVVVALHNHDGGNSAGGFSIAAFC